MKYCQYCGQTITKLDKFGYCKKYDCFGRSGKREILNRLISKVSNIYTMSQSSELGITSYVTNYYNPRTRFCNDLMREAEKEFGFVPQELLDRIPEKHKEKWDKRIRW
jgi:hypothetical protein